MMFACFFFQFVPGKKGLHSKQWGATRIRRGVGLYSILVPCNNQVPTKIPLQKSGMDKTNHLRTSHAVNSTSTSTRCRGRPFFACARGDRKEGSELVKATCTRNDCDQLKSGKRHANAQFDVAG